MKLVAARPANGRHTPPKKPDNVARLLPHSTEAEESLLGAMMLSPRAIAAAADAGITPADYYAPNRGHIHHAITTVHARGLGVDAITVAAELDAAGLLEQCGGSGQLTALIAGTLGAGAAANHAALIADFAHRRTVMAAAAELTEAARTGEPTADILARITGAAPSPARTQPLPVTPVHELLANPPERRPVIIDGLLRQGELCVVVAEANVGKSWWCMQLALTLAEGHGSFLGFRARRPCRVMYAHQEMDAEGAYDRWTTLLGNDTMPPRITDCYAPIHLGVVEELVQDGNRRIRRRLTEGHEAFEARIAEDRPDVVFLDTWGAVFDGDENDKADTQAVVSVLWAIAERYGCAIVVVHHYRKLSASAERRGDPFDAARGSSRLIDAAHTRIAITGHYTTKTAHDAGLDDEEARRYADVQFRRRVGRKPPGISMRFDPEACRWLMWEDEVEAVQAEEQRRQAAKKRRADERKLDSLTALIEAAQENDGGFASITEAAALMGVSWQPAKTAVLLAVAKGVLVEITNPAKSGPGSTAYVLQTGAES